MTLKSHFFFGHFRIRRCQLNLGRYTKSTESISIFAFPLVMSPPNFNGPLLPLLHFRDRHCTRYTLLKRYVEIVCTFLLQICFQSVLHFTGIFVLLLIVFISVCLTFKMQRAQSNQLRKKDGRVQRIFETVINLKVIKLHVWEPTFEDLVSFYPQGNHSSK